MTEGAYYQVTAESYYQSGELVYKRVTLNLFRPDGEDSLIPFGGNLAMEMLWHIIEPEHLGIESHPRDEIHDTERSYHGFIESWFSQQYRVPYKAMQEMYLLMFVVDPKEYKNYVGEKHYVST